MSDDDRGGRSPGSRDRDEYGRFMSDDDRGGRGYFASQRDRDEYGRFKSDYDRGGRSSYIVKGTMPGCRDHRAAVRITAAGSVIPEDMRKRQGAAGKTATIVKDWRRVAPERFPGAAVRPCERSIGNPKWESC